MPVLMESVKLHEHYDPTGTIREVRAPGDRYTLEDGGGCTAEGLATLFESFGWARRVTLKLKKAKVVRRD